MLAIWDINNKYLGLFKKGFFEKGSAERDGVTGFLQQAPSK
jgi:hypothetical protein